MQFFLKALLLIDFFCWIGGGLILFIARYGFVAELKANNKEIFRELDRPGFLGEGALVFEPLKYFPKMTDRAKGLFKVYFAGNMLVYLGVLLTAVLLALNHLSN